MRRKNITTLQKCVYCDYFRCTLAQEVTIYVYVLQAFRFIQIITIRAATKAYKGYAFNPMGGPKPI